MLKQIIIIGLALFSLTAFSQSRNSNEIVAEGGAKIIVRPDLAMLAVNNQMKFNISCGSDRRNSMDLLYLPSLSLILLGCGLFLARH